MNLPPTVDEALPIVDAMLKHFAKHFPELNGDTGRHWIQAALKRHRQFLSAPIEASAAVFDDLERDGHFDPSRYSREQIERAFISAANPASHRTGCGAAVLVFSLVTAALTLLGRYA